MRFTRTITTYIIGTMTLFARIIEFENGDSHLFKSLLPNYEVGFIGGSSCTSRIPIRIIDFSDPDDKARHDRIVSLVDSMLSLHEQLAKARTNYEQTLLQRQIEATDEQIDKLVYELYGLTEEEIKIVEAQ